MRVTHTRMFEDKHYNVPLTQATLRDAFAAEVVAAMIANPATVDLTDVEYLTSQAYTIADAMMEERRRKP